MRPTTGVRYAVERSGVDGKTVIYSGFAHLPDADVPLVVRVEEEAADGRANVVARVEDAAATDAAAIERAAAALIKAAARSARDAGRSLPRRIVRWRGG